MNIYVGNLHHAGTEAELRTTFEAFGTVGSVTIIKERSTGQSRGFGFVEMLDPAEATTAISVLDGQALGGLALRVNEARPKTERGPGGQGGAPSDQS